MSGVGNLTKSIPAGTLVRINFPENAEFHKLIGYVTNKDPYPDSSHTWYTVQLFEERLTYDFTDKELEILP